jgi:hypothetical protein
MRRVHSGSKNKRAGSRRGLILAWMPHSQRAESLGHSLGGEVMLLARPGFRRPASAPFMYPVLVLRSIGILLATRPPWVIVVVPPVVAPLVIVPLCRLLGIRVAVDVHSGALLDRRWRWSVPLLRLSVHFAGLAIVTLPSLVRRLSDKGVEILVVPDPLPEIGSGGHVSQSPGKPPLIVGICGWGDDEPIKALVDAVSGKACELRLTGRPRRRLKLPPNVRLTGFLDRVEYVRLLESADVIVVLTTRENTLLSGVWEALALGRPIVTSRTRAIEDTFQGQLTTVAPDPESIWQGIHHVIRSGPEAARAAVAVAQEFRIRSASAIAQLQAALTSSSAGDGRDQRR